MTNNHNHLKIMWCLLVMISTGPTFVSAGVSSTIEKIVIIINNIFVFSHYIIIYRILSNNCKLYILFWCSSFLGQILFSGKDIWVYRCIVTCISNMHVHVMDQDLFEIFCLLTAMSVNEYIQWHKIIHKFLQKPCMATKKYDSAPIYQQ